jgi:hypothetical protein
MPAPQRWDVKDAKDGMWGGGAIVALTTMSITCRTPEVVERCVKALAARTKKMARQPERIRNALIFDLVLVGADSSGGTVRVAATWYDEEYYVKHSDDVLRDVHEQLFTGIGIAAGDVVVRHFRPDRTPE